MGCWRTVSITSTAADQHSLAEATANPPKPVGGLIVLTSRRLPNIAIPNAAECSVYDESVIPGGMAGRYPMRIAPLAAASEAQCERPLCTAPEQTSSESQRVHFADGDICPRIISVGMRDRLAASISDTCGVYL